MAQRLIIQQGRMRFRMPTVPSPAIAESVQINGTSLKPYQVKPEPKVDKTSDLAKKVGSQLGETIFLLDTPHLFHDPLDMFGQLVQMRHGISDRIQMLAHPPNSVRHLVPAAICLYDNAIYLTELLPGQMADVDLKILNSTKDRLVHLRSEIATFKWITFLLEAQETHLEQSLYDMTRPIAQDVATLGAQFPKVRARLDALARLVTESQEQAEETKKNNDKLRKDTKEETLAQVQKDLDQAIEGENLAGTPPPVPPPKAEAPKNKLPIKINRVRLRDYG